LTAYPLEDVIADTERRLKDAQRLLQQGVITEAEYESRRQAILADTSGSKGSVAGGILKWGGIGCLSIIGAWTLVLGVIFFIITVAGDEGSTTGGTDTRAAYAVGSSGTVETAGSVKVKVTIDSITDPALSTNEFVQPQPGNHYVAIGLTVVNAGERETKGAITGFRLRARDGFEYERAFVSGVGSGIDADQRRT